MGNHTKGPWHIGMKPGPIIYGPKGEQVADLRGERKTLVLQLDEAVANTKLICAAPDLLQALEDCLTYAKLYWSDHQGTAGADVANTRIIAANAAIKKAKGQ